MKTLGLILRLVLLLLLAGAWLQLLFNYPYAAPTDMAYANPENPHNTYTALTDKCAACHRVHTAAGRSLRKEWPEEATCFACHDGTGATTDLQTVFAKTYKHPVAAQSGVHARGESGGDALANRHAECEDCHNPHNSSASAANAPSAMGPIQGPSGVSVDNGTSPGAPIYTWASPISNEYELCFKCHSSYTTGYTGTDKGADFNTNNPSYHPVEAAGKNTGIDPAAFVSPWSETSLVYCSDCHGNDQADPAPQGSHGSANSPILKKPFTQADYWSTNAQSELGLCFDCHSYAVYYDGDSGSRFRKHDIHVLESNVSCYACHESHGRSDTVHLIRVTTAGPVTSFTHNPTSRSSCYATCHEHGSGGMFKYKHAYQ